MRAGNLDRSIVIERVTTVIDEFGTPQEEWAPIAAMRAQIVQASTEEFMRNHGASTETAIIFRLRYLDGITPADRVIYQGTAHSIAEIKEIGRRRGLELRTIAKGAE